MRRTNGIFRTSLMARVLSQGVAVEAIEDIKKAAEDKEDKESKDPAKEVPAKPDDEATPPAADKDAAPAEVAPTHSEATETPAEEKAETPAEQKAEGETPSGDPAPAEPTTDTPETLVAEGDPAVEPVDPKIDPQAIPEPVDSSAPPAPDAPMVDGVTPPAEAEVASADGSEVPSDPVDPVVDPLAAPSDVDAVADPVPATADVDPTAPADNGAADTPVDPAAPVAPAESMEAPEHVENAPQETPAEDLVPEEEDIALPDVAVPESQIAEDGVPAVAAPVEGGTVPPEVPAIVNPETAETAPTDPANAEPTVAPTDTPVEGEGAPEAEVPVTDAAEVVAVADAVADQDTPAVDPAVDSTAAAGDVIPEAPSALDVVADAVPPTDAPAVDPAVPPTDEAATPPAEPPIPLDPAPVGETPNVPEAPTAPAAPADEVAPVGDLGSDDSALNGDIAALHELAEQGRTEEARLEQATSIAIVLEAIAESLAVAAAHGGINQHSCHTIGIAVEHLERSVGFYKTQAMPAMESFNEPMARPGNTQIAVEDIREKVAAIWAKIVEVLKKAVAWGIAFFAAVFKAAEGLKAHAVAVQAKIKATDAKRVTPKPSFENERLVQTLQTSGALAVVAGSANMLEYGTSIFIANGLAVGMGAEALAELQKPDAVKTILTNLKMPAGTLLHGEKLDNPESMGFPAAPDGLAFIRGKELPGGKALLGVLPGSELTGQVAADAIAAINTSVGPFNPKAVPVTKKDLATLSMSDAASIAQNIADLADLVVSYRGAADKTADLKKQILAASEKMAGVQVADEDKPGMDAIQRMCSSIPRWIDSPAKDYARYSINTGKAMLDYIEESIKQYA